jgi:hypothetical protein
MSTDKINEYARTARAVKESAQWAALYGKHYHGGGGGFGYVDACHLNPIDSIILYYQETDGAKNYHHIPLELRPFVEQAIMHHFPEVLKAALALQRVELRAAALAAKAEYTALLKDAGISPEDVQDV